MIRGKSVKGRNIIVTETGRRSAPCALILGGFHGDEPKSVRLVNLWRQMLVEGTASFSREQNWIERVRWVLVPVVNPDGFARRTRRNANNVDLNRNFPTENWSAVQPGTGKPASASRRSRMYAGPSPASEPETRVIIKLIQRMKPACIITVHSISGGRYCNNYDGPGRRLSNAIAKCNRYPVAATIGYPTPGSFGTWAGIEQRIPTITLELPAEHSTARCLRDNSNVPQIVARYLQSV